MDTDQHMDLNQDQNLIQSLIEDPYLPYLDQDMDMDIDQGYTYDLITTPWKLIQPTDKHYRLEIIPQGKKNIRPRGSI